MQNKTHYHSLSFSVSLCSSFCLSVTLSLSLLSPSVSLSLTNSLSLHLYLSLYLSPDFLYISSIFQETVEVFLSHPAGVKDEADIEGRTAFMWAAGKGADDVVRMFTKHKADINQTDQHGGTGQKKTAVVSLNPEQI